MDAFITWFCSYLGTILTIIGTFIAFAGLLYAFFRNFKMDIKSHIDRLDLDVRDIRNDLKSWTQHLIEMQAEQTKLFHQFREDFKKETIESHKEMNNLRADFNKETNDFHTKLLLLEKSNIGK